MAEPKVYIGSCIWREVNTEHMQSLFPLMVEVLAKGGRYAPQVGDALIDRARGISATAFLNSDCDVHLSIDSDIMGFTIEDALGLCQLAETHDVVAASYACRSTDRTFPASYYEGGVRVVHHNDHTPVAVKWAATGFLAVHRRVFEKLKEGMKLLHPSQTFAFYNFYGPLEYEDEDTGEPILLSEDWSFCQRAKEAGFGIWLDPAIRLGHVGSYIHRLEDVVQPIMPAQPLALTRNGKSWCVEGIDMSTDATTVAVNAGLGR